MASITLTPDAIVANSGFSSTPTTSLLSAQDTNWAVASATNTATSLTVSFGQPSDTVPGATLTSGNSLQSIPVQVRKNGGTGTPSFTLQVTEGGTTIFTSNATNVTSTTGQVFTFFWDSSSLADKTGANVQVSVTTLTAGGSPSVRATVDYGYIGWTATYNTAATLSGNSALSGQSSLAVDATLVPASVVLNGLAWTETSFNNGTMYGIVARNAAAGNRVGWLGQFKTAGSTITSSDSRFVVDASGVVTVASGAAFTAAEVGTVLSVTFTESLSGTTKPNIMGIWVKDIALTAGAPISPAWDANDTWSKAYSTVLSATQITGVGGMNSTFPSRVSIGYPGDTTAKLYIKHTVNAFQANSGTHSFMIGFVSSTLSSHRLGVIPGGNSTSSSGDDAGTGIVLTYDGYLVFDANWGVGGTTGLSVFTTSIAVGDTYEMAIDPTNKKVWVAYNGTWSSLCGDPGAGGAGISYVTPLPDIFAFFGPYNADTITNTWTDTAPAGFQNYAAGLPNPIVTTQMDAAAALSGQSTLSADATDVLPVSYLVTAALSGESTLSATTIGNIPVTASFSSTAAISANAINVAPVPGYDVVLMIGDSYTVGIYARDVSDTSWPGSFQYRSRSSDANYQTIDSNTTPYSEPLGADISMNPLSPVEYFAKAYYERTGRQCLVVPYGFNGSHLLGSGAAWPVGASLHEAAITQTNAAIAAAVAVSPDSQFVGIVQWLGTNDLSSAPNDTVTFSRANFVTAQNAAIADFRSRITGAASSWYMLGGMLPELWAQDVSTKGQIEFALRDVHKSGSNILFAQSPTGWIDTGSTNLHPTLASNRLAGAAFDAVLGDATAPTINNSDTYSFYSGSPAHIYLSADRYVSWDITGPDAANWEVVEEAFQWANGLKTSSTFNYMLRLVGDANGPAASTQNITLSAKGGNGIVTTKAVAINFVAAYGSTGTGASATATVQTANLVQLSNQFTDKSTSAIEVDLPFGEGLNVIKVGIGSPVTPPTSVTVNSVPCSLVAGTTSTGQQLYTITLAQAGTYRLRMFNAGGVNTFNPNFGVVTLNNTNATFSGTPEAIFPATSTFAQTANQTIATGGIILSTGYTGADTLNAGSTYLRTPTASFDYYVATRSTSGNFQFSNGSGQGRGLVTIAYDIPVTTTTYDVGATLGSDSTLVADATDVPGLSGLVCMGDSWTAPSAYSPYLDDWSAANPSVPFNRVATSGWTIADLQANVSTVASYSPSLVTILIGLNDLGGYVGGASAWLTALQNLVSSLKSAIPGVKVAVATVPAAFSTVANHNAYRAVVNPEIRAGVGVWHDAVIPIGDYILDTDAGDGSVQTTYYQSPLPGHPTSVLQSVLGKIYTAVLDPYFANSIATSPSAFTFTDRRGATVNTSYTAPTNAPITGMALSNIATMDGSGPGTFQYNRNSISDSNSKSVMNGDWPQVTLTAGATSDPAVTVDEVISIGFTTDTYSVITGPVASDTFTRADGALGVTEVGSLPWIGTAQISSGQAVLTTNSWAYGAFDAGLMDFDATMDVTIPSNAATFGAPQPMFWGTYSAGASPTNSSHSDFQRVWKVDLRNGSVTYLFNGGSFSPVTNTFTGYPAGTYTVRIKGDTSVGSVHIYVDDVLVCTTGYSTGDANWTPTGTYIGCTEEANNSSTSNSFDNITIEPLQAVSTYNVDAELAGNTNLNAAADKLIPLSLVSSSQSVASANVINIIKVGTGLSVSSALNSNITTLLPTAATLGSSGSLTVAASNIIPVSSIAQGTSTLTSTVISIDAAKAQLGGSANLLADVGIVGAVFTYEVGAALTSASTLNVSPFDLIPVAASLSGTSNLAANSGTLIPVGLNASSQGNLTATPSDIIPVGFLATGGSGLGASALLLAQNSVSAFLTGNAMLSAAIKLTEATGANLNASSATLASISNVIPVNASFASTSNYTVTVVDFIPVSTSLSGQSNLGANVGVVIPVATALAGDSAINDTITNIIPIAFTGSSDSRVDATAGIVGAPITYTAAASLGGASSLSVATIGIVVANANLQTTSNFVADIKAIVSVGFAATSGATATASIDKYIPLAATFGSAGNSNASVTAIQPVTALLSGSGIFTPSLDGIKPAAMSGASTGTMDATVTSIINLEAVFAGATALNGNETVLLAASSNQSGTSLVGTEALDYRPAKATLTGTSTLSATTIADLLCGATMTANATLDANGFRVRQRRPLRQVFWL